MTAIIAVRHARPRETGVCYGRSEFPVIMRAGEAARLIRRAVDGASVGKVWSSPSSRCAGPALLLAAHWGVPLALEERLYELDFGEWEGRPWLEIEAADADGLQRWMQNWTEKTAPGGESLAEFEGRIRAWYRELDPHLVHVLVAHAGVVRCLRVVARCDSWPLAMETPVPYLQPERF